jgi:hypothetical protein
LDESGIVGKRKNRRRTADAFYIVFKFNKKRCTLLNRKCLKYVEIWWALG